MDDLKFLCHTAQPNDQTVPSIYRTRAIITCGLYIFYPILEGQKHFLRSFFRKIVLLCTVSIQERVMMARTVGSQLQNTPSQIHVNEFVNKPNSYSKNTPNL